MTTLKTDPPGRVYRSPRRFRVGAGVLVAVLVLAGCSDDDSDDATDSDPAAVLAAYEETRNAGDVDAVMALGLPRLWLMFGFRDVMPLGRRVGGLFRIR